MHESAKNADTEIIGIGIYSDKYERVPSEREFIRAQVSETATTFLRL